MSYVISLAYMQNGTRSSKSNMGGSTNLSTVKPMLCDLPRERWNRVT